ncbi:hypothetical protein pdam_00022501 [Pocillopora damicornis]|uniref:Uncharacterized protein n=1 Tax=Pocillopora damicornis TaxID=46731 RepID=A0A3M6TNJ7_POCDA|nr:hypothetical protein pdam_00022501 [Pocillopora damicornis]
MGDVHIDAGIQAVVVADNRTRDDTRSSDLHRLRKSLLDIIIYGFPEEYQLIIREESTPTLHAVIAEVTKLNNRKKPQKDAVYFQPEDNPETIAKKNARSGSRETAKRLGLGEDVKVQLNSGKGWRWAERVNMQEIIKYGHSWQKTYNIYLHVGCIFLSRCEGISKISLEGMQSVILAQLEMSHFWLTNPLKQPKLAISVYDQDKLRGPSLPPAKERKEVWMGK